MNKSPVPGNCLGLILAVLFMYQTLLSQPASPLYRYAVVIKKEAHENTEWRKVAELLLETHNSNTAKLFIWQNTVTELKSELSEFKPDYIGFVGRPASDVTSDFVHTIHQLCRDLDDDAYADAVYGIITGYEADDAIRAIQDSVIVKTAIIAHQGQDFGGFHDPSAYPGYRHFNQAIYTSEGGSNYPATQYHFSDGTVFKGNHALNNQEDRIITYSNWLNQESINVSVPGQGTITGTFDFFSTSGHGNINSWQAQFPSAQIEGYLRSKEGKLYGDPIKDDDIYIKAPTAKIYFATGNCLIGKPDNKDNMVYAWFHSGRAVNMFGYIITSGYGYMGWGNYERFVHFPGIYSAAECFYITNQSLLMDIENKPPGINVSQLERYRDNTILYGDPKAYAYSHYFGDSACLYLQDLQWFQSANNTVPDTFVYTITPHHHTLEVGSTYKPFYSAFRPFQFLPVLIDMKTVRIAQNDGHSAVITDNFVLWDLLHINESIKKGASKVLRWTAKRIEGQTNILSPMTVYNQDQAWLQVTQLPGENRIRLQFSGLPNSKAMISIHNAKGQRYARYRISSLVGKKGKVDLHFDSKMKMLSGIYFIIVQYGDSRVKDSFLYIRQYSS